ncbi:MAG: NFACT RNA binding domain-containing protein [Candidatus Latescibacterota bacterium]
MGMDILALQRLVSEIGGALKDRPILSVLCAGKYDLFLQFSPTCTLLISCLPGAGRTHLVPSAPEQDGKDSWGKGRLEKAVCLSVEQMNEDRVLCLRFVQHDQIGGTTRSMLVVEMTGRNSNVILVDEASGKILDCLRRIPQGMNRYRQILPGARYTPPPPQDRLDPRRDGVEVFAWALRRDPETLLVEFLSRALLCADRSTAHQIISRSGLAASNRAGDLEASDVEKLYRSARSLYLEVLDCGSQTADCKTLEGGLQESPTEIQASVFFDDEGTPADFTAFDPIWVADDHKRAFPTLSQAIACFYEEKGTAQTIGQTREALESTINRLITAASKKVDRLEQASEHASHADDYRRMGELLTTYLYQIAPRQETIILSDFSDPSEKITIPLDPSRSPAENAQHYFAQYRKATRGAQMIKQLLSAARERLSDLGQHGAELASAQDEDTLTALRDLWIAGGTIGREEKRGGPIRKAKTSEIHPRRYLTSEGWTVLVGRTDWENDLLTHRAHPDDLWFHAQGCAGSHVVLRREGRKTDPGKRSLEEAAGVAAYWSKARSSKTVPVNYTLRKHVRKPRRAKAGSVLIEREKTLFVEPKLLPQADSVSGVPETEDVLV